MVDLCTVILVVHAVLNSKVNGERLLIHHDNNWNSSVLDYA